MQTTDTGNPAIAGIPHQHATLRTALPVAAILCAVLLWGSSFAAMGYALNFLNPWSVMWLRMVIPLVILLPLAGRLTSFSYQQGDWKLLLPMVLCQPCLYFLLESNALRMTTSSQAGVVAAFVPVLVAIGAFFTLGEPFGKRSIIGTVVSLAGVVCLTLMQSDQGIAANPYLGNAMELCAMVCAAGNMLLIKKLSQRYNVWSLTALQIAAGAVFFLPGLVFLIRAQPLPAAHGLIQVMLYLGAGVTLGAFGCYNWGMSRMPAGKASAFINLVPVIAVVIGWKVMGDTLTAGQWMAAMVVIGGIWMGQRG